MPSGIGFTTAMYHHGFVFGLGKRKKDMKTIEERAYRKALSGLKPNAPTVRELLIEMATEQRKIDIDKACEWFENWAKDDRWYTIEECQEMLRKALEEEI